MQTSGRYGGKDIAGGCGGGDGGEAYGEYVVAGVGGWAAAHCSHSLLNHLQLSSHCNDLATATPAATSVALMPNKS